jgi:hypothetical protein
MEPNDKLVRRSSEMATTLAASLKPQEITLLREMRVTAANAKVTLVADLNEEFLRVLSEFPAEAVEVAFRGWRDVSPYFPAISDIRELCLLWVRRQAEAREEADRKRRREEIEAARGRGELIEWPDVVKQFADICTRTGGDVEKKIPEPPPREIVITPDRREMLRQQLQTVKAKYAPK